MVRNFVLLLDDVFQRGGPHYDRIVDYLQRARRARFFALPARSGHVHHQPTIDVAALTTFRGDGSAAI